MSKPGDIQLRLLFERYIQAFNLKDLETTMSFISFPLRLKHGSNDSFLTFEQLQAEYRSHWEADSFKSVEIKGIDELHGPEKGIKAILHDHGQGKVVTVIYHYEQGTNGEWMHSCHDIIAVEAIKSDTQTIAA